MTNKVRALSKEVQIHIFARQTETTIARPMFSLTLHKEKYDGFFFR